MIDLLQKSSSMCDDIAWGWILTLFGSEGTGCTILGGLPAADLNSPYANAFAVLTASLAFIGSLFLAYHVVIGIVSSAYTGKVLGEKWHQIWAPLRVVFGFGMLIPIGDGFSSVHYLLRDVVGLAAVNLGNAVIGVYVSSAFDPNSDYVKAKITTRAGNEIVNKFFAAEVCTGIIRTSETSLFTDFFYSAQSPTSSSYNTTGAIWNYGSCGVIKLADVEINGADGALSLDEMKDAVKAFNTKRLSETKILQQKIHKLMDYDKLGEFLNSHASAMETSNDAIVQKLRTDGIIGVGIQDELKKITDEWDTKVGDHSSTVFEIASRGGRAGAIADISKYGFMAAGSYERTLSSIASFISSMASAGATNTTVDLDESMINKIKKADAIISSSKAIDNNDRETLSESVDANDSKIDGVIRSVIPTNLIGAYYSGTTSLDPVGDMIVFGNQLLAFTGWVIVGLLLLKIGGFIGGILAGLASGGGPVTGVAGGVLGAVAQTAISAILPWIAPALIGMILIGLMHSFVLPMIPFIMVFIMGISWLLMFLEGAIAGVLWAFIFIRMDGTEFADQKQSPGISLLFNLLLRPALGMLAFAGMILLLPALLNGLMVIWASGFVMQTGNQSGSIVQLYQLVAQAVVFAWMQWTITLRLASLIPSIADRVGHWMGMSSTSGYSDGMETGATIAGAVAATHAVSSGVRGAVGSATKGKDPNQQGIGDKIAAIKEQKNQANNQ